jgi:hypothetical protein
LHWSLIASHPDGGRGPVWQVKGDATHMEYKPVPAPGVNIFSSGSFTDSYILTGSLTSADIETIDEIARTEQPPRAANMHEVTENCQGWTVRVIKKVAAKGLIPQDKVAQAEALMEPVKG